MDELDAEIRKLADARRELEFAQGALKAMRDELEARHDYRSLKVLAAEAQQKIEASERDAKAIAIKAWIENGNKRPHKAVTVKEFTALRYDDGEALEFCAAHLKNALKFDRPLFERHAKAVAGTSPLEFATIVKEQRAQIASDLSEYAQAVCSSATSRSMQEKIHRGGGDVLAGWREGQD